MKLQSRYCGKKDPKISPWQPNARLLRDCAIDLDLDLVLDLDLDLDLVLVLVLDLDLDLDQDHDSWLD
jgi:hypothetical protein